MLGNLLRKRIVVDFSAFADDCLNGFTVGNNLRRGYSFRNLVCKLVIIYFGNAGFGYYKLFGYSARYIIGGNGFLYGNTRNNFIRNQIVVNFRIDGNGFGQRNGRRRNCGYFDMLGNLLRQRIVIDFRAFADDCLNGLTAGNNLRRGYSFRNLVGKRVVIDFGADLNRLVNGRNRCRRGYGYSFRNLLREGIVIDFRLNRRAAYAFLHGKSGDDFIYKHVVVYFSAFLNDCLYRHSVGYNLRRGHFDTFGNLLRQLVIVHFRADGFGNGLRRGSFVLRGCGLGGALFYFFGNGIEYAFILRREIFQLSSERGDAFAYISEELLVSAQSFRAFFTDLGKLRHNLVNPCVYRVDLSDSVVLLCRHRLLALQYDVRFFGNSLNLLLVVVIVSAVSHFYTS